MRRKRFACLRLDIEASLGGTYPAADTHSELQALGGGSSHVKPPNRATRVACTPHRAELACG